MDKEHRLRSSSDFRRVLEAGTRVSRPELVLYHAAEGALGRPRVGFAVPRRIGGAVVRNRVKRVLREAARSLIPRLVACDIIVVARPAARSAGKGALEEALQEAAARAGLIRIDG